MDYFTLIAAGIIAAVAGVVRGITGFGGAMVMAPPLALLLGPKLAVPVILVLESVAAAPMLIQTRHLVHWKMIGAILLAACVTVPLGVLALVAIDPAITRRVIAVTVIVFAVILLRGWRYAGRPRLATSVGLGAVSGAMLGATSIGGPPVILYLLSGPDPIETTRANLTLYRCSELADRRDHAVASRRVRRSRRLDVGIARARVLRRASDRFAAVSALQRHTIPSVHVDAADRRFDRNPARLIALRRWRSKVAPIKANTRRASATREKFMEADRYSISELANDVKRVCAESDNEHQILMRVRPLAHRAALSKSTWLEDRMYQADATQGFGVHLIHEEPDHTIAILALAWLPDRGAPPHDHGTWAVVAGVDGPEKNEFFERADDRSRPGHAELKKIGQKVCGVGDVVALPKGTIHSVWNETDKVSLSLHIYGKHINYTGRSQFDLKTQTETPFIVKMQS